VDEVQEIDVMDEIFLEVIMMENVANQKQKKIKIKKMRKKKKK
jgi:hypothetical protein